MGVCQHCIGGLVEPGDLSQVGEEDSHWEKSQGPSIGSPVVLTITCSP